MNARIESHIFDLYKYIEFEVYIGLQGLDERLQLNQVKLQFCLVYFNFFEICRVIYCVETSYRKLRIIVSFI